MPTFPGNFGVVALHPALLEADAFLFLEQNSGNSALLDAYLRLQDGSTVPLYTLTDTKTILNGSGAPTSGVGSSGDFYIDTDSYYLYGPKTGDSANWPTGYSLQGPSGAPGATEAITGEAGPAGTGVPAGGVSGQVIGKTSSDDYETDWFYPRSLLQENKIYDLRNYNLITKTPIDVPTQSTSSFGSSVTHSPLTNSLYIADNTTPAIYEMSLDGKTCIRKISLVGFSDIEGIDWMYGDTFVICEEGNPSIINEISIVTIPVTGIISITKAGTNWIRTIETNIESVSNKGIEGVTYNPFENVFYFVTEYGVAGVWNVWKINNDGVSDGSATQLFSLNTALSGVATDISDIYFNRHTNTIFTVSDEGATGSLDPVIIEFDLSGNILQTLSLSGFTHSSTQVEGLTFSADGGMIFVTAEGYPYLCGYNFQISNVNPSVDIHDHYLTYYYPYSSNKVTARVASYPISVYTPFTGSSWSSGDSEYQLLTIDYLGSGALANNNKYKVTAFGTITAGVSISLTNDFIWDPGFVSLFTAPPTLAIDNAETDAPWKCEVFLDIAGTGVTKSYIASQFWDVYGSSNKYSCAAVEEGTIISTGESFIPWFNVNCIGGTGDFIIKSLSLYKV